MPQLQETDGPVDDGGVLSRQAAVAREMKSGFVSSILEAARRQLHHAPLTARRITTWPGDRDADGVGLRLNGALHALARRGATRASAALYRDLDGDFDAVLAELLAQEDDFIDAWMRGPPQTNEVGRAAAIMAALGVVASRLDMPFELLEFGSSAGLNLNMARYAYDLAGVAQGDPASALRLAPVWQGAAPPSPPVRILSARGVDIDPLDVRQPEARERLMAYVWADQPDRLARLGTAIATALEHPPRVDRDHASNWLTERLAEPQPPHSCRVVFQSIVLQYMSPEERSSAVGTIRAAGDRATASQPLAWISYEWDKRQSAAVLKLSCWPEASEQELALCHAHSAWIRWLDPDSPPLGTR